MNFRLVSISCAVAGATVFAACSSETANPQQPPAGAAGMTTVLPSTGGTTTMPPVTVMGGTTAAGGMTNNNPFAQAGMTTMPPPATAGMPAMAMAGMGAGGMPTMMPPPPMCETVPAMPVTALPMQAFGSPFGLALMGRAINAGEAATMAVTDCSANSAAVGICNQITWTPVILPADGSTWAGAIWQTPNDNWGDGPLLNVAAGATSLTFNAWGAVGDEVLEVTVGGLASLMTGCGEKSAAIVRSFTLTTAPQQFTIDLSNMDYSAGVIRSFGFVMTTTTIPTAPADAGADIEDGEIIVFIDDPRWVQ